jgi:tetratricopeptide (TPR) repeat protein
MIVVEPASMRYENPDASGTEEHLLERITVLENRLGRLAERLERSLDLLLRQAQNSYLDRSLLKSLIELLAENGIVESEELELLLRERCEHDAATQEESNLREQVRGLIMANFRGADRLGFEELVGAGFAAIEAKELDAGVQSLRRAIEKDPGNGPLLSFLGEHFFRTGKMKPARDFLNRAAEVSPQDNHILLLLGLACGDEGETEKAKQLLEATMRSGGESFAAHYGLGRLFAAEQNWQKAVREFKRALTSKPSPEAHYALACVYYQLGRDSLATRHLLKAVEMDERYGEAFHLLGLVYQRVGNLESARSAFEKASLQDTAVAGKKVSAKARQAEPALFRSTKRKRLLTGGDVRLARALREDALRAFLPRTYPPR